MRFVWVAKIVTAGMLAMAAGCLGGGSRVPTPAEVGLNTNDLVDPPRQIEAQAAFPFETVARKANSILRKDRPQEVARKRSILCLSGGGAYGAFSAGVLCGWTARGDRPCFDVVTGVSTGGLIAPLAFLGPAYDAKLERLYTTVRNKDLYRLRPVRGIFDEALADTTPLARQIDQILDQQMMLDLAIEHSKGRRLFLGTTESQGRRFVAWDIGEIACRGRPEDRELIKLIMLGSSAIPGIFPPARIPVTVDGKSFVEKHVDGSVSFSMFIRPPTLSPEEQQSPAADRFVGIDVYAIEAGKLYADPKVFRPWVFNIATANIETLSYAQSRGDITRLWAVCLIAGMNFHLAAIPQDAPVPDSSTDFVPAQMRSLFNVGAQVAFDGSAWRKIPPGGAPGEDPLVRATTDLNFMQRGQSQMNGFPAGER